MKLFLTASLLIIPILSLPTDIYSDASNTYAPDVPSGLIINTHSGDLCRGPGVGFNAQYGVPQPLQTLSYHLNRDVAHNEQLDFFNALPEGSPIDMALQGNNITCMSFIRTAKGSEGLAGCHALNKFSGPIGCFLLTNPRVNAGSK